MVRYPFSKLRARKIVAGGVAVPTCSPGPRPHKHGMSHAFVIEDRATAQRERERDGAEREREGAERDW